MSSNDWIGDWVDPGASTDVLKRNISVFAQSQIPAIQHVYNQSYLNELSRHMSAIGGHHNYLESPKNIKSRDALEFVYLQNY
jgi:hypothetical protein